MPFGMFLRFFEFVKFRSVEHFSLSCKIFQLSENEDPEKSAENLAESERFIEKQLYLAFY